MSYPARAEGLVNMGNKLKRKKTLNSAVIIITIFSAVIIITIFSIVLTYMILIHMFLWTEIVKMELSKLIGSVSFTTQLNSNPFFYQRERFSKINVDEEFNA